MLNWISAKTVNAVPWRRRLVEFGILVAHLVLLKWILYVLGEGGVMPIEALVAHFAGIAIAGALLIRFCAWMYHRLYLREQRRNALGR
jgi:apolipoprotein N-acyltransferase